MAGSVSKVILIGNLGKDPEVRSTQAGGKIVSFTLATSGSWNDKANRERKERTEWHRIVVFNEQIAEVVECYLKKGFKVYVERAIADAQVDRPSRAGEIYHGDPAGPLQRCDDHALEPGLR